MAKESGTTSVTSKSRSQTTATTTAINESKNVSLYDSSQTLINNARDKAFNMANTAKGWLQPDWSTPAAHFESLTTVMFSPMAAHPVYKSESLVKAIQLAQQQQRQRTPPSSTNNTTSDIKDLVLHSYGSTSSQYPWPSSSVLLKADIPESNSSLSLFQGFATTYPSLTVKKSSKRSRNKKKKQQVDLDADKLQDKPVSLKRVFAERERKIREIDKLQMQMTSTSNEIRQIDLQIDELINKRKELETKWTKLEAKEQQIQIAIEDLTEKILDETDDQNSLPGSTRKLRQYQLEEESDEEYDFGECFKSLHGHERGILSFDFNEPKGQLVSSSLDGTVRVWDLRHGRVCGQLDGYHNLVRCLQLDDMRLITGSDDGTIKQWDITDVSAAPTPASTESFSAFSSAPASPSLTSQKDNTPSTLDKSCVLTLEGHQSEITALHADATNVVSGSNDKTMKLWDLETQNCVLTMDVMWASQHSGGTSSSSSSWSMDSFKFNFFEPSVDYVGALQFWNFALASGTVDGKLRMWDLRTGQAHRTLPGHKGAITALQFDEIHLVSGSADKTIRVWDLRTGTVFETLTFSDPISSLRFNAGRIMSTTDTNDINIYNRTSFQHSRLSGHTDTVNTLQLKKDTLASGGKDGVVKLWAM